MRARTDVAATNRVQADEPLRRRTWRSSMLGSVRLWRLVVLFSFVAAWELASGTVVSATYISNPSSIAARLYELFATGEILPHLKATLVAVSFGYVVGALAGLALGGVLGRIKLLGEIFEPFILAAYAVPKIALAPLFLIWLGLGTRTATAVVILSVFFLVFYGTFSGMRNMDDEYVNQAKVMGAGRSLIIRKVIAPAALPFVIIGLKTAVPYAVIGAIVGEFMGSSSGIGYFILLSGGVFDTAGLFAGVIVLVLLSTILVQLLSAVERWAMKWRPTASTGSAI